jgi:hypothetical protein
VTELIADAIELQRVALRINDRMLQALALFLAPHYADDDDDDDEATDGDVLTARQRERLRVVVHDLQDAFEVVTDPRLSAELRQALKSATYLATTFSGQIIAWMGVIDTLVEEAERAFGTAPGRGAYKREQLKAAILTIVHRQGFTLPLIPGFLQPAIFAYSAQIIADFVVAHLNDNELWDYDALPAQPTWRAQVGGVGLYYVHKTFDASSEFLSGFAWRIVMAFTRLSPGMQQAVDRVQFDVSGTVKALAVIARFAADNPDFVRAMARIVSIATREAETFIDMTGPQKQAYAHDLILAFLEENALVAESGLWAEIVSALIKVTIDSTVDLFNRRGLFSSRGRGAGGPG